MNTTTVKQTRQPFGIKKFPFSAIIISIVLVIAIGLGIMMLRMNYVPVELDTSTTRMTEQGIYEISYTSDSGGVPINQIQNWTLNVKTAEGQPVESAAITVDGDMPQHGHGLPTRPQVTGYLGNGDYKVEGLKFHMPGWWVVDFVVTADGQTDQVRFNMMLK
ncbi:MAG: FixH family protein [Caldilineaceae bacterium]|nr:FixH family protein [Caldilineaceae bacterium]